MRVIVTEPDIGARAVELLQRCRPTTKACIIALSGDVGVGKTRFVQAIAKELGVTDVVTSPTFIIERIYEIPPETGRGFARFVHIDAYRLETEHELVSLGWHAIAADPLNLIVIEWPEKVAALIPNDAERVMLSHVDEQTRVFTYGNH